MKLHRSFVFSVVLLSLWMMGCGGTLATIVTPTRDVSDNYNIDKVQEKKVGDVLLSKIDGKFYNGYEVRNDYQIPLDQTRLSFGEKLQVIGRLDNGDHIGLVDGTYGAARARCMVINKETSQIWGVMSCDKYFGRSDNFEGLIWRFQQASPEDTLKPIKIYAKGSHKTELSYTGKSGKVIKFQYREYNDDIRKPSLTQDLSFDLGESANISVANVNLKVLDASNSKIKYKVQSVTE